MESQVRKINVRCPIKEDQKWVEAEGINAYPGIEHGPAASKAHNLPLCHHLCLLALKFNLNARVEEFGFVIMLVKWLLMAVFDRRYAIWLTD